MQDDKAQYNSGVASRNAALDYIEKNRIEGIVYIMDDDNTYFPQVCLHQQCNSTVL